MKVLLVLVAFMAMSIQIAKSVDAKSKPIHAWTVRSPAKRLAESVLLHGRNVAEEDDEDLLHISLNFEGLKDAFANGGGSQARGSTTVEPMPTEIAFTVPGVDGHLVCSLVQSQIFHPDLAARYPQAITKSGKCEDGREVHVSMELNAVDSLSSYFTVPSSFDYVYVDNRRNKTNEYVAYFKSKRRRQSRFQCDVKSSGTEDVQSGKGNKLGRRVLDTSLAPTRAPTLLACKNAQAISLSPGSDAATFNSDNQNLDSLPNDVTCASGAGAPKAGWVARIFRFVASSQGVYEFTTCVSATFDSVMSIRADACDGPALGCNDDSGDLCSKVAISMLAGQVVFVQVAQYNDALNLPSNWGLRVTRSAPTFDSAILRLAVVANYNYSAWAGGTTSLVLTNIAATIARVNGIYVREFAIYMQLIAEQDQLLCVRSTDPGCSDLVDNLPVQVLQVVTSFIESNRGVPSSRYDIGHVFTTGAGGLASVGVLCQTGGKARGVTGISNPTGDAFAVDYVAHELGHQFGAEHTFRNCVSVKDSNAVDSAAVEPGSGSTIMAYAGICQYDLQKHSDPYFHSFSITQIRAVITSRFNSGVCGGTIVRDADRMRPAVDASASITCSLPVGNYFVLRGQSNTTVQDPSAVEWYQWDQVNAHIQSYTDLSQGVFRSWKPTRSRFRYFPNLYYLTRGIWNLNPVAGWERLPPQATVWKMRFMIRSLYSTLANSPSYDANERGDVGYYDMFISFVDTVSPLKFTKGTRSTLSGGVGNGTSVTFSWTGATTLSNEVVISVAPNTMQTTVPSFDYERDLKDLDWIEVGRVPNTGFATLVIPTIPGSLAPEVNWMIATTHSQTCAAFDYVARGTIFQGPTLQPTSAPTRSPTTSRPTKSPSVQPKPTGKPTSSPTITPDVPRDVINHCIATPNTKLKACKVKIEFCKSYGIDMKWGGANCKKKRKVMRDAGCVCAGYCGYTCRGACRRDKQCVWIGSLTQGSCYTAEPRAQGHKISNCYTGE